MNKHRYSHHRKQEPARDLKASLCDILRKRMTNLERMRQWLGQLGRIARTHTYTHTYLL